jgi:hypothetical protein
VLQVLSPPSRRWGLDRWAWSLLVTLPKLLLWTWLLSGKVFKLMKLCIELCCFRETNSVCNILYWTPMDVIRMLLVNCCNEWCAVLNHYDLGLLSKVIWNPTRFPDYRGYGSLSTGIWSPRWLFLYLHSHNLVGSVTHDGIVEFVSRQSYWWGGVVAIGWRWH